MFVFVVQTAVIMPVRIAFFDNDTSLSIMWLLVDVISDCAFLVDIIINFNSVEED